MFKVGDKVRCIESKVDSGVLIKGSIYTVCDADDATFDTQRICLEEVNNKEYFYSWRFQLVSETEKTPEKQKELLYHIYMKTGEHRTYETKEELESLDFDRVDWSKCFYGKPLKVKKVIE